MPKFSRRSLEKLSTCHPLLQDLFNEVIKYFDCTVLEGFRSQEDQDRAFFSGTSKIKWPNGKHNKVPSLAVDVVPYPIDWHNTKRFILFSGFVLGVASQQNIKIRWGGDWNMNTFQNDQSFNDLPHFELLLP